MMARDTITEIYYITGILQLISPLAIGSGESEVSDKDVLLAWDGSALVPGTAIAGSSRQYLWHLMEGSEFQ